MRWLAILHTMWGPKASGKQSPRFFNINPQNCSGRVLHQLFGDIPFVVTNASPLMGSEPNEHQKTDATWLKENLLQHEWRGILVCGHAAQEAFQLARDGIIKFNCPVLHVPHPASRSFRNVMKGVISADIRLGTDGQRKHYWCKESNTSKWLNL